MQFFDMIFVICNLLTHRDEFLFTFYFPASLSFKKKFCSQKFCFCFLKKLFPEPLIVLSMFLWFFSKREKLCITYWLVKTFFNSVFLNFILIRDKTRLKAYTPQPLKLKLRDNALRKNNRKIIQNWILTWIFMKRLEELLKDCCYKIGF